MRKDLFYICLHIIIIVYYEPLVDAQHDSVAVNFNFFL